MKILNVTRGSYKEVIMGDGPYVRIDGMDMEGTGWLQIDFRFNMREKHSIVECFNEINHVYAFGHDPVNSAYSVTFLVFLGKECMEEGQFVPGQTMRDIVKKYISARVSQSKSTTKITYSGTGYHRGMITGLEVNMYDEEMNAATVTVGGNIFADTK